MNLQLLGPVEGRLEGRPLPLGATKQRAVLAMLALQANDTVSVNRLVDGLWGDEPPATATKMVQLYVSQLRRLLGDDDAEIVTHGRGYQLRVDPDAVDVARFESLVEEAGRHTGAPNDRAREALELWRGAPLANVAEEPFAAAEIRRLEELRLRAAELAVDGDLAAGRDQKALAELERLVEEHPLRERFHAQRMLALYRCGRQAEALEAYATARRQLVEEVGVEPSAELRELQARILRQDPSLERPAAPPSLPAERRAPREPEPPPPTRSVTARRLAVAAAVLAAVALCVFAITRLTGGGGLTGIAADGVGVIDASSAAITTQYRIGSGPGAVTDGAGSVWVARPGEGTVSRVHPGEDRLETIDVGPAPADLVFGGGSLWVADGEHGAVAQVDPRANRVVQRIRIGNGLSALAVGYGAVWAATALDGEVVRIDLRSGRVTGRIAVGGYPVALTTGAGSVWAASEESGSVVRIDPGSNEIADAIAVGNGPTGVAAGPGGVWSANRQDGTVSRIDTETSRVTNTVPAGHAPAALTVADGGLWVADASGALLRLDLRTGATRKRVRTGSTPVALATVDGDLWVTAAALPSEHRGGTLRVGTVPIELDPADGSFNAGALPVVGLAYDSLLDYRRVSGVPGGRLVADLAAGVPKPSDGERRYVLRLRRGLKYSDGAPVQAADFRSSLERILAISGAGVASLFDSIEGVDRCLPAGRVCDLSRGITVDQRAGTIRIQLRHPDPELLQKLRFVAVVPSDTPPTLQRTRPPPGTGPYRFRRVVPGRRALLERNPHFRARDSGARQAGFADRVEVAMGDEKAHVAAVERGRRDLASVFEAATAPYLRAVRTRIGTRLRSGAYAMTEYAWLNTKAPPFDDPRVRRALNLAVDRGRVVSQTGGPDAGAPTCQLLPPGLPGYRPICTFTATPSPAGAWTAPNQPEARRLVRASGARGTSVEVWTWPPRKQAARQLADVLDDLGFSSRVRVFGDLGKSLEAAADPRERPQIGLNGWIADAPDPGTFLRSVIGCRAMFNLSRFCDRPVDAATDKAQAGGADARAAWERIERQIARRAPVVPLTTRRSVAVTSRRTGNVQFHPIFGVLLDQVWVR